LAQSTVGISRRLAMAASRRTIANVSWSAKRDRDPLTCEFFQKPKSNLD
jgi:hypothetical protein